MARLHILSVVLFALALSADGLGVGLAYGLKRIRIPVVSLLIMCCCSMTAVLLSMLAGKAMLYLLSPAAASFLGGIALIAVGLWMITGIIRDNVNKGAEDNPTIATLNIKPIGIIIQILRQPARADLDESGVISYQESVFLGMALALDGLGAGIGASMAGLSLGATVLTVGVCQFLLVRSGLALGNRIGQNLVRRYASIVSGLILCILGILYFK